MRQNRYPEKTATEYRFNIVLTQHNEAIAALVAQRKAEYACEVVCSDTYLRRCFHSPSPVFNLTLLRKEVSGRINFNCYIAAKQPIQGYTNKDFNEDYLGFSFDLDRGEMLALFPTAFYNTNIKYDKLYAAGSFMQIVRAAESVETTWFNLDDESGKIMIELPADLFTQYEAIGNSFPEVIHSSLVHNALVYALSNLDEYADKGKLWSDSLLQRLQSDEFKDIDVSSLSSDMSVVFKVADRMLQDPYKRLLGSLQKINENLTEDTED